MSTTVASVGTTHPRNLAGLGRDARVAADWGVAHVMAVAAVSAQDERGVHEIFALPPAIVREQLGAMNFQTVQAVRIGALGSVENAATVAHFLEHAQAPIVFDPVMHASAGGSLYADDALEAVRVVMQRVPIVLTPNIEEAQILSGVRIRTVGDMVEAGKALIRNRAKIALITGGHLSGDPVDVLVTDDGAVQTFADTRLPQKMRGTGCTLAMALTCELALGRGLVDAVKGARAYVRENIARS
ncbi:MAG TPA: bifunctional hydroxymethylpyrimidine kinase/phosphomethylpyrimidine kinase [Candidatus Baltobacteraceae bacterium]|nr:bifunctional hydroxymethylpyrimidine kinase/phosphomethylpyrimidine kinase [Candidatus Baltobacteraceae bacterium]